MADVTDDDDDDDEDPWASDREGGLSDGDTDSYSNKRQCVTSTKTVPGSDAMFGHECGTMPVVTTGPLGTNVWTEPQSPDVTLTHTSQV